MPIDEEKFGEFSGKVITTLEKLAKSDDDLYNMIKDEERVRISGIASLEKRIRDLEDRVSIVETKISLYWWITTGLVLSVLLGIISIMWHLWI